MTKLSAYQKKKLEIQNLQKAYNDLRSDFKKVLMNGDKNFMLKTTYQMTFQYETDLENLIWSGSPQLPKTPIIKNPIEKAFNEGVEQTIIAMNKKTFIKPTYNDNEHK